MTTLSKLKEELEPFRNTLVIEHDTIVRLVDVIDGENKEGFLDDYYWVFDSRKGIYHSSCVGGWIPLKGFIDQKMYERMVHIWNLNNIDKAL